MVGLEEELRAVLQLVVEVDLGDGRLDQYLQRNDVDLVQHSLDHRIFSGGGIDQESVVGAIGDDADPVHVGVGTTPGLRRQWLGRGRLRRRRGRRRDRRAKPAGGAGATRLSGRPGGGNPSGCPADTRGAPSSVAEPQTLLAGAGGGAAGRRWGRRDVAGGEGTLQQAFEVAALAILHVIDMPGPRGRILDPPRQPEEALRRVDVTRLRGHDENRVDARHRQHLNNAGERSFGLGLKHFFELARKLGRIVVADRK